MIRNILLVAYRSLTRQFSYSVINITGLAIGIACSLVIFLFVYGEWSYDRGFTNADRIYRVGVSFFNIGQFANGPERLLEVLPREFNVVQTATRIRRERGLIVTIKDQTFKEPQAYYTDTAYFKVFNYTFLAGDLQTVLGGPAEAVITETIAQKFFGKSNAVGEVLGIGKEKIPYTVKAIVREPDFNTHLKAPIWLSVQSQLTGSPEWSSAAFYNYVLLKETFTESDLRDALDQIFEKYVYVESGQKMGFKSLEDYGKNENAIRFYVHRLKDIYLKSKLNLEISPSGSESNIYVFSAISFFILVLAAVNFVNLSTARASRRAKEVGIRKTLGTSRGKLIGQFLLESVVTSLAAMLMALVLSEAFLLVFEYVAGSALLTTIWNNPLTIALFFGFSVLVGLLSGLYPAFYLTSFRPVKVLKGNLVASGGGGFRNFLVVFQFSVSIVLIACAVVVQQQLHFIQTKDLGFAQENVVTIDNADLLGTSATSFKAELGSHAGVINSSYHMGEPGSKRIISFYTYQTPAMESAITINTYFGDEDYIAVLGLRLIKGRGFNKELASDTAAVILNEAAVGALGLGDDPIGALTNKDQRVIAVVSNFHWESLRSLIAPLSIVLGGESSQLGFKLETGALPDFLKAAGSRWKQLVPDEPFQYHFLDGNFEDLLEKEAIFGKSINFFTLLAIFISSLGLYGLSAYTAEQRTKEIGIRKVLGATGSQIVIMLNRKFTILVLVAVFISIPISFYVAMRWLEGFAYRIELSAAVFLISISGALMIAWLTVSYHAIKASWINPSDTLKYE